MTGKIDTFSNNNMSIGSSASSLRTTCAGTVLGKLDVFKYCKENKIQAPPNIYLNKRDFSRVAGMLPGSNWQIKVKMTGELELIGCKINDNASYQKKMGKELKAAISSGSTEKLFLLIPNIKDINKSDYLFKALVEKNDLAVKLLVANGASLNQALGRAAASGKLKVIQTLIDMGAEINSKSVSRLVFSPELTPLCRAVSSNQLEAVKFLIKLGANMKASHSGERSALEYAVDFDRSCGLKMTEVLLQHPDCSVKQVRNAVDQVLKIRLRTPSAYKNYRFPMLKLLLAHKHKGKMADSALLDLLHQSYSRGNPDIGPSSKVFLDTFELMLKRGAKVNDSSSGETVLHRAIFLKLPKVVDLLLKYGADVNALDRNKLTPLQKAMDCYWQSKESLNIAERLLKVGAKKPSTEFLQKTQNDWIEQAKRNIDMRGVHGMDEEVAIRACFERDADRNVKNLMTQLVESFPNTPTLKNSVINKIYELELEVPENYPKLLLSRI